MPRSWLSRSSIGGGLVGGLLGDFSLAADPEDGGSLTIGVSFSDDGGCATVNVGVVDMVTGKSVPSVKTKRTPHQIVSTPPG